MLQRRRCLHARRVLRPEPRYVEQPLPVGSSLDADRAGGAGGAASDAASLLPLSDGEAVPPARLCAEVAQPCGSPALQQPPPRRGRDATARATPSLPPDQNPISRVDTPPPIPARAPL